MGYRVGILHSSDMGFGVYRRLVIVSELLCESVDLRANIAEERVLHTYFPLDPHAPPGLWGTQEGLAKLFGDNIASLCVVPRSVIYRFRSPEAYVGALQIGLGPFMCRMATLSSDRQEMYRRDLVEALGDYNRSGDETLVLPFDYIEMVAAKR